MLLGAHRALIARSVTEEGWLIQHFQGLLFFSLVIHVLINIRLQTPSLNSLDAVAFKITTSCRVNHWKALNVLHLGRETIANKSFNAPVHLSLAVEAPFIHLIALKQNVSLNYKGEKHVLDCEKSPFLFKQSSWPLKDTTAGMRQRFRIPQRRKTIMAVFKSYTDHMGDSWIVIET